MKFWCNAIKKTYTVAVGKFLNDIWVQRFDFTTGQLIKEIQVPVMHGPKLHWWMARYNNIPENYNIKHTFPMISYAFTGMSYAGQRQLNPLGKLESPPELSAFVKTWSDQAVPWDFSFNCSVWSNTAADIDQIIEQLVYQFKPTYNLHIKEIPMFGGWRTCRLKLDNMTLNNTEEYDIKGDRVLKWNMGMTLEGHVYPVIQEQRLLRYIETNWNLADSDDTTIMTETFEPGNVVSTN